MAAKFCLLARDGAAAPALVRSGHLLEVAKPAARQFREPRWRTQLLMAMPVPLPAMAALAMEGAMVATAVVVAMEVEYR